MLIVSTDIFETTNVGLDFTANPQTWTISAGVVVSSSDNDGVLSSFDNSTLFNFGEISAGLLDGVLFNNNSGSIVNEVGALVIGSQNAIEVEGDHETIDNLGSLIGLHQGVLLGEFSNHVQLTNRGSIFGHLMGVEAFSIHEGGTVTNFGAIRSDQVGVSVQTNTGLTTFITNAASGFIAGATHAIQTIGAGAISLNNHGTVAGNIDCTVAGAHDVIINHGKIKGAVLLDSGNDVFNGTGGTSGAIFAGGGNDRIVAGNGKVKIHVGSGSDTITGGPGADRFIFDSALGTQVERITNFKPAVDKVVLSEADFPGLGPHGVLLAVHFHIGHAGPGASPQIIYTPGNGFLYYDSNGHLPGGMTHFATLLSHPVIHNTDFIVEA